MGTGNPVCQPGKACVVQAEGKVAGSAWAPPSIRMDRANRARAESGKNGRRGQADCPQKERKQSGGPQAVDSGQAHGEG